MAFTLPENLKLVNVGPIANADSMSVDYICCKNAHRVWFVIVHTGANDTDLTLSLTEGDDVSPSNTTAVTKTWPYWVDTDAGTSSDGLVRGTDAASYAIDPATMANVLLVIEWDPAKHDPGYDCITVTDSGGHSNNETVVIAFIQERYPADQPPSAIID